MKRRIFAVALSLIICIIGTLCSCKSAENSFESAESFADSYVTETEISKTDSVSSVSSSRQPSSSSAVSSTPSKAESSAPPPVSNNTEVKVQDTIVTDEEIEEPIDSPPIEEIKINNSHTSVLESDYYQYSMLGQKEKMIYERIVETITKSNNVVDFSKLKVSYEDAVSVLQKVLADYPQFFYISRNFMLVYGGNGETVRAIVLLYSDGTVVDEFDENLNLLISADRTVINQKISELKQAVETAISEIPADLSDVAKEKKIHDFVANTVKYDYSAAEKINTDETLLSHAFDLYGAAVNKTAVCEGYSKYFQYLCYSVGINSTQVIGTADGGNHMWNTVLIDGEWYQLDVTWDDSSDILTYSYFNLTDGEMAKDHITDFSALSVPECTSSINSFKNTFAVCVDGINRVPVGFEEKISNILAMGDSKIYVYIDGYSSEKNSSVYIAYIRQFFTKQTSEFYLYLASKGKTVSTQIYTIGEYFVLIIT